MRHTRPPTVETMLKVQSEDLWLEANLEPPLAIDPAEYEEARSRPDAHPDDLLDLPGIRVKGGYRDREGYAFYGKLVKFRGDPLSWNLTGYEQVKDDVVVMSTLDRETVWFGSVDDYHAMWCVD
jgi:hypothetical protein